MSNKLPFKQIADAALARAESLLAQWLPDGQRIGHEWKALNPTRGDSRVGSFSVNVNTGAWADFATSDAGGDLVSLYAYLFEAGDQGRALRELAGIVGIEIESNTSRETAPRDRKGERKRTGAAQASSPTDEAAPEKIRKASPWVPIMPVPSDAGVAPVAHEHRGPPEARWEYRAADGQLLGIVCRFKTSDGGKEVLPLHFCRNTATGQRKWRWISASMPRPLYGLDRLQAKPEASVLLVEGEKCADVAHEHLPHLVAMSWPGGGKAADKADWSPLAGRKVLLWPDCDAQRDKKTQEILPDDKQPGIKAMATIAQTLLGLGCKVWMLEIPPAGSKPSGWDIADAVAEGFDAERLSAYLREGLKPVAPAETAKTATHARKAPAGEGEDSDRPRPWIPALIYKKGELSSCLSNVYQILAHHPAWQGVVAYDEFSLSVMKRKPAPYGGDVGEWGATDDSLTAMWLSREFQFTPASATVAEAVEVLGRAHAFHPVREWLHTLEWDQTPRLNYWLSDHLGVEASEYTMHAGCWWLMGAVKRVLQPGCKFDYCLVLSGMQGKKKSTVFEILAGDWFGDTDLDLSHKDSMSALRGKLIYEIAELGALARSEEKRQKSFLSRRVDEYRPVYGRREIKAPRQLVFGGTTNEHEWNKDATGGRRFWPVECLVDEIDTARLRAVREQLWAEAFARVLAGEKYWPDLEEQRKWFDPEQLRVEQQDSLVDAVHDWVYARIPEFSLYDVAADCLKLDASKLTRDLQTRLGVALRKLGCTRVERRNGMVRYWYKPPQKSAGSMSAPPAQPEGEDYEPPL